MNDTDTSNEYTLVIVDDDVNILRSLRRLFRRERLNLLTADSAEEALDIIRSQEVQVLLTDNLMPGMSGVELTREVKKISPRTIRLVLSGQSDLDAVLAAINEGEVFRFIQKPWNDLDLKATVSLAMAHYRLVECNQELMRNLKEKERLLESIRQQHPEIAELQEMA